MNMIHWVLRAMLLACMVLALGPAHAQDQPIRIIFPFAAGGSGDGLARLIADKMRAGLNRPVIVESRTGASGRIGVQAVKSAAPDGNTLLITPIAPMAIYQSVYASLDYDPIADFIPLSQVVTFDFGVAVGPQITAASLKDLVAWAKANPTQANYGIPAAGSLPHFLGVMFGRTAGLDLRAVPYRGSAAALTDLVGGQIAMVFTTTSDLAEMHKGKRIRMLATSDRARSPFVPEVPTFREAGYDLEATGWYGMFAPAKTPPDVVERLNKAIVAAVRLPEVQERLRALGLQPTGTSAKEFAEIQKNDAARWAPHVKASGFKPEQ
jgi:tripartite-type tricarboxylate transporter receptor subunit TctC